MSEKNIKKINKVWFEDYLGMMLTPYTKEFSEIEYGRGFCTYMNRLKKIGIYENDKVLDAGGGIGNWSIPLGLLNKSVEVVDISSERLLLGSIVASKMQVENVSFRYASIDKLPYPDASFDAVVCYSVIMFTDVRKTLSEFYRVLKPGGRIFVMTDLWRWYFGQGVPQNNKAKYYLKLAYTRLRNSTPKFLTVKTMNALVENAGFRIVCSGQDGQTSFLDDSSLTECSFYPSQPDGLEQLWEICAIKERK